MSLRDLAQTPALMGLPISNEAALALVLAQADGSAPESYVRAAFADGRTALDPRVVEDFQKPAENLPYDEYIKRLVTPRRISDGAAFLSVHRALLDAVTARYGLDEGLLVSLVGIESDYGTVKDPYDVFNALYTIVRLIPDRRAWAARELAQFLSTCRAQGWDVHGVPGSYAGAFGYFQFEPTSFAQYAVDFDGDGKIDPQGWPDVFGSMANYLKLAGFTPGAGFSEGAPDWCSVYAYNHSRDYVGAVLTLRAAILAPND